MTAGAKLGLPTDIPWRRICVSEDMLDPDACDEDFPPKWHSSIAVFSFTPDQEYQQLPDYEVSYLKVAVTVTGYQPHDKEVEGSINWDGLNVETISEVEALLAEYHPCTGAVVQVVVEPRRRQGIDPRDYPFFIDFEPKKRELFEMATDTKERSSRSLESLSVGKSASTLQSTEVLDIDMGGSTSVGAQASYAGTGGGFNFSSSTQGQWGTKSVGQNQSGVFRQADEAQEKRESHSFTTQISQLYHLLDSYHLGTNRAVFFIQPRPHVIEEPSGIVRGPRPIEGVQEFFLVVAKPKQQGDFCVSVRLDTAHLATIDIMDYDRSKKDSLSISASASAPTRVDDPNAVFDGYRYIDVTLFGEKIGERRYKCMKRTSSDTENYIPPFAGYRIDTSQGGGYTITSPPPTNGTRTVNVAPDGSTLTATVTATGRRCFDDGGTVCIDCPDHIGSTSGSSTLSMLIHLISNERIKKIGTDDVVLITTRGVCCCDRSAGRPGIITHIPVGELVLQHGDRVALTHGDLRVHAPEEAAPRAGGRGEVALVAGTTEDDEPRGAGEPAPRRAGMAPRAANALSDLIQLELKRAVAPTAPGRREPQPVLRSDFFLERLEHRLRRVNAAAGQLDRPAGEQLPEAKRKGLAKHLGKSVEELTNRDIVGIPLRDIAKGGKLSRDEAAALRLAALGLPLKGAEAPKGEQPRRRSGREPKAS